MYKIIIDMGLLDLSPHKYHTNNFVQAEINLMERKKSEILRELCKQFGQICIVFIELHKKKGAYKGNTFLNL